MFEFTRVRAVLRATSSACAVFAVGTWTVLGLMTSSDHVEAKTPGSTYCFYGKCHRVKTLSETRALIGKEVSLYSSHYDSCHRDRYNPCGLTSSGEPFFADRADNAASPIYPDGTKLLVWSPQSQHAAVVRINNAGPYWGNRKLDVSRALARKLGFERRGVAKLQVRVLSAPTRAEARYKRNRRYAKVHGPIGKFASLDEAEKGLAVLLAFEAMTTAVIGPSGGGVVTHIDQPFEVAAKVTQGRAFADVRPELKHWPVVARQFATLEWPVVGDQPNTSAAPAAPVQVAVVGSRGRERATQVNIAAPLKTWPVVQAPRRVNDIPLIRVALAWPVVNAKALTAPSSSARLVQVRTRKSAKPLRRKKVAAVRKARSIRVAALKSKQKRKIKARKRLSKAGKRTRAGQRLKGVSKSKVKPKVKAKFKQIVKVNTKPKAKPTARMAKRTLVPRPHVATRKILHRALGRGA